MVSEESERIRLDQDVNLVISGCEWPWSGRPCHPHPMHDGDIGLVLSHSADAIYNLSKAGATLVFSGHYHAGQFQLPWIGPLLIPSVYGRRFYHGHFRTNQTHLFVSAGIGADQPPLRLYCPPDILVVDLQGGADRLN